MRTLAAYRPVPLKTVKLAGPRLPAGPDDVFVCEGLARPSKGAHWCVVDVWKRKDLAVYNAERTCREELLNARNARVSANIAMLSTALERIAAAQARYAEAAANLRNLIARTVDPALGMMFVAADCPDLVFVNETLDPLLS